MALTEFRVLAEPFGSPGGFANDKQVAKRAATLLCLALTTL